MATKTLPDRDLVYVLAFRTRSAALVGTKFDRPGEGIHEQATEVAMMAAGRFLHSLGLENVMPESNQRFPMRVFLPSEWAEIAAVLPSLPPLEAEPAAAGTA